MAHARVPVHAAARARDPSQPAAGSAVGQRRRGRRTRVGLPAGRRHLRATPSARGGDGRGLRQLPGRPRRRPDSDAAGRRDDGRRSRRGQRVARSLRRRQCGRVRRHRAAPRASDGHADPSRDRRSRRRVGHEGRPGGTRPAAHQRDGHCGRRFSGRATPQPGGGGVGRAVVKLPREGDLPRHWPEGLRRIRTGRRRWW